MRGLLFCGGLVNKYCTCSSELTLVRYLAQLLTVFLFRAFTINILCGFFALSVIFQLRTLSQFLLIAADYSQLVMCKLYHEALHSSFGRLCLLNPSNRTQELALRMQTGSKRGVILPITSQFTIKIAFIVSKVITYCKVQDTKYFFGPCTTHGCTIKSAQHTLHDDTHINVCFHLLPSCKCQTLSP